eukprot:scaffold16157_cov24-Tisochrysis_lutea.AAC.1
MVANGLLPQPQPAEPTQQAAPPQGTQGHTAVNTCNPRGSGPAISPAALGCMPVGELISVQEGFISVQGRLTRCRGGSSWLREGSSWCRGGSSWLRGGSSRRDVSKRL